MSKPIVLTNRAALGSLENGPATSPGTLFSLRLGMSAQFAAGGAVVPFVTLLLNERGLNFAQVSQIFTVASATLLVFPFFWGMLADRFIPLNRVFFLLNAGACAGLAMLALARGFSGMLLGYAVYFACFNPSLYLINALCFHHLSEPREEFGGVRAWGSLGWIVPFLPISIWLALRPGMGWDFILYWGMGCSLLMAAVSFWLPHTPPGASRLNAMRIPATDTRARGGASGYGAAMRALLSDANYLVVLISMFLMAGSFSLLTYYSPARLEEIGVPRPWIGPVQAIGVIFEIVLFRWQPALLRRWNYTAVVLGGCIALALRHLVFTYCTAGWGLAASYLLAGAVIVFYNQGVSVLVNSLAAGQVRSTAQTLLLLCGQGLGPLFANAVAGRLGAASGQSLAAIFLFAAGLSGAAALVILLRGSELNRAGRLT